MSTTSNSIQDLHLTAVDWLDGIGRRDALPLTSRQRLILVHAAHGLTSRQIAGRLLISEGTVRKHLENSYKRLHVTNRAAAVALLVAGSV